MEDMSEDLSHITSNRSVPHRLIKWSFATHKDDFASKCVFDQMKMNLTNVEEVFVNHITRDKKLLMFLHRYHRLGYMKLSWRPMSKNKNKNQVNFLF